MRTQMTRRGKMAIITLDDASAQVEISVFNELWDAERSKIKEDELLLVEGKVQRDDYSGGLRVSADKLMTLAEARGRHARVLKLSLNGGSNIAGRPAACKPCSPPIAPPRMPVRCASAIAMPMRKPN